MLMMPCPPTPPPPGCLLVDWAGVSVLHTQATVEKQKSVQEVKSARGTQKTRVKKRQTYVFLNSARVAGNSARVAENSVRVAGSIFTRHPPKTKSARAT